MPDSRADGLVPAGRFPLVRSAALAADVSAHRGRKFWVSFAQLRRMASATPAGQLSPPGLVTCIGTSANHPRCVAPVPTPGSRSQAVKALTEARPMNASMYLAIIAEHHRQRSVLRLQGELDVSNRDRLRHAINSALQRHPATVVVDLSGLNFTDCAGLSVLVWAHKRLAGRGQQLVIAGATPIVQQLLRLTDLDAYLHLSHADAPNDNPDERTYA